MNPRFPVILNGRLVPAAQARISVFDRGFLYGDGLFETLYLWRGQSFRWEQHLERLEQGAQMLGIPLPFTRPQLEHHLKRLAARLPEQAVLRLAVSRGCGPWGYSPSGCNKPTWVMSAHPAPQIVPGKPAAWNLITSNLRLSHLDSLAACKTANKLAQILARTEAEARGGDEALLLNDLGQVVEAASANIFWLKGNTLGTPILSAGALPGITRQTICELAPALGLRVKLGNITVRELRQMDGVFLSLSTRGIVEVASVDGKRIAANPRIHALHEAYWRIVFSQSLPQGGRITRRRQAESAHAHISG
jgi:branched-chain amino acid aminotransferase